MLSVEIDWQLSGAGAVLSSSSSSNSDSSNSVAGAEQF
jgi:hypothetical protein